MSWDDVAALCVIIPSGIAIVWFVFQLYRALFTNSTTINDKEEGHG